LAAAVFLGTCALLLPSVLDEGLLARLWLSSLASFLAGMLLARFDAHGSERLRRARSRPALLLALGALALLAGGIEPELFGLASVAFAIAAVVLGLGASTAGRPRVLLDRRLIVLGTISYGVFLWHAPLLFTFRGGTDRVAPELAVAGTAAALVLTIAIAIVSWRFLEAPVLRRTA
jgi:peptidoglycan/LPS O-acetylase OafA/YrhL